MTDIVDTRAITALATEVVDQLIAARMNVATAESCTGGWIAKAITDIPGSSNCFGYGIVSYSNAAKESLLGVPAGILEAHGAVSGETVAEMARGALRASGADIAVAVSGIAGPGGGTEEKPVGTVWFAWATSGTDGRAETEQHAYGGDREAVRALTVKTALKGLHDRLPKRA